MSRIAQCNCGKLKVIVVGPPSQVAVCHCVHCQHRTGSTFSYFAYFPVPSITVSGEARIYEHKKEEGSTVRFYFCQNCGGNVYYDSDRLPGQVGIPVGTFDDPDFPPPLFSVFERSKRGWVSIGGDVRHSDELPVGR